MANGYISCKGKLELEDNGDHIWNELYWRSFFQDVVKYPSGYTLFKMHDLMHDLAQSIMEDECHIIENESSRCIPKQRIHHVSLLGDIKNTIVFPKSLQSVKSLRSILLQYKNPNATLENPSDQFSCDFRKLRSLRAIDATGARKIRLSSLIGNLKHLRFLNLSETHIQTLPKSICSLLNLQTLNLNQCNKLRRLPKNLKYLRSLRHLYLKGCTEIHNMPPKLGQLTLLKTLSLYCVGKRVNQRLAELQHLDLGGELRIEHLERVRNSMDAEEANLVRKQNLRIIELHWSRWSRWSRNSDWESQAWSRNSDWESQANVEQLLEALRPHHNVEELFIHHYKGSHFPLWMRDSTLKNLVSIRLVECRNCLTLPPFGQLPSLRCLDIAGMDFVEYVDDDFPGGGPVIGFPSLEELYISDLPNLKGLSREEGRGLLPRLGKICIENCPKLTLPCLSSSGTLTVEISRANNSNMLLSSISNLNRLTSLTVRYIDDAVSFPEEMLQNLTLLESLEIEECRKLKLLPSNLSSLISLKSMRIKYCDSLSSLSESFGHLTALEELSVDSCRKLVAIPESIKHLGSLRRLTLSFVALKTFPESLQHVTSLQSLSINYCMSEEFTSLPEWLGNFSSLQSLSICGCPKIQSLPQSIQSLTKLKTLSLWHCGPELERRCQKGNGEDWYKIAHVPEVDVQQDVWIRPSAAG